MALSQGYTLLKGSEHEHPAQHKRLNPTSKGPYTSLELKHRSFVIDYRLTEESGQDGDE
jgi:hypothetical protein